LVEGLEEEVGGGMQLDGTIGGLRAVGMAEGVDTKKPQGLGGTGVEVGSPYFGGDGVAWR
jgi:hypothetical protein